MESALISGRLEKPLPGRHAICPECGGAVVAKCGEINAWHWAHEEVTGCPLGYQKPTGMSYWHREWQDYVLDQYREVRINNHIADIVTSKGQIVELQHSPLTPETIRTRERDYGVSNLIWVFNVRAAWYAGRLRVKRYPDYHASFVWGNPKRHIGLTTAPTFLDLHKNSILIWLRGRDENMYRGEGFVYTRYKFLTQILGLSVIRPEMVGAELSRLRTISEALAEHRESLLVEGLYV